MNRKSKYDYGTLGERWVKSQISQTHPNLPRFANLRDGGNLPHLNSPSAFKWTTAFLITLLIAILAAALADAGQIAHQFPDG